MRFSYAVSTPCAISGLWLPIETETPHEAPSKPFVELSYPMVSTVSRTIFGIST